MWGPPENKDPILVHHPTRRRVGYFGAVRLRDGRFVFHRATEHFNAVSFFECMKRFARASRRPNRRIVVVTDHATYHHATLHKPWRETQAPQVALDFLPPDSPELNPIARVWKLTRRRCVHNRSFPTIDEVVDAVEAAFTLWARGNDTLRRLCAIT